MGRILFYCISFQGLHCSFLFVKVAEEEALALKLDHAVVKITTNLEQLRTNSHTMDLSQREMLAAVNEVSVDSQQQADHIADIAAKAERTSTQYKVFLEGWSMLQSRRKRREEKRKKGPCRLAT